MDDGGDILKRNIGFSEKYMDRSRDPSSDFYGYCNGKWMEENSMPEDKSRYGAFDMLYEKNMYILKSILENAEKNPKNHIEKQLGIFYRSAMDTESIEKVKFAPVEGLMHRIGELTPANIPEIFAELTIKSVQIPFDIGSAEDAKNADTYSLYIGQDGLSLPDRDYYLNEQMKPILEAYKKHISNMFALYSYDRNRAEKAAEIVISIETDLAKYSRSKTDLRDVEKAYNKFPARELYNKYPELGLERYLSFIGASNLEYAIVDAPEFFKSTDEMFKK